INATSADLTWGESRAFHLKKQIDIEKLLHWAYRDELPKQTIGGLTGYEKMVFLGTLVDEGRPPDGGFPVSLGPPHPDALLVDYMVRSLPEHVGIQWPASRGALMGHLAPYVADDDRLVCSMAAQQ